VLPAKPVASPSPPSHPKPSRPAPLANFDRRAVRQIASGKVSIDARLDLHGMRQRDAHARLRAFLLDAQARGCRTVLVITGKGGESTQQDHLARAMGEVPRGVLRRGVPQWLEEPDLRAIVLSYTSASVRHGGEGALYVQLRKAARGA
jgi:DNA-nicking Smr family endonuclease